MWQQRLLYMLAGAILVAVVVTLRPSTGIMDVAHESTRFHLHLFGSSVYEHHARTGKWPVQIEDLAKTSLPLKSPYWKQMLDDDVDVIVWHKALKPDPKDNADQILAYHNKGLISERGQSWVCWGDLRTEYIQTEALRHYLQNRKD